MKKLSPILPDHLNQVSRKTVITVAEVIAWIDDKYPDALKNAIKTLGQKEVKAALNELEAAAVDWREL